VSQPSGQMRAPGDKRPDLIWSALIVAASVLGGVAATDVCHEYTSYAVGVSLLVAAVLVFSLYIGWFDAMQPAPQDRGRPYPGAPPVGPGHTAESRVPPGLSGGVQHDGLTTPYEPVREEPIQAGVVRVVQPSGARPWWDDHAQGGSGRRGAGAPGPRAVDLSKFLDQALIAQCPNCGAFRVDYDNRAAVWGFRCQECRQEWTWQPGTPWPAIQIRPTARVRRPPPRA